MTGGKDQHRSSENLFLPSKRRECFGTILAEIIKSVGLQVPNDPSRYSSRVSNKCAHKMRNLGHIYGKVNPSLEAQHNHLSTLNKENIAPTKHLLKTLQGNSPCRKAVCVNSPTCKLSLQKSLSFERREITNKEWLDVTLHVEKLLDKGNLQVKVAFVTHGDLIATILHDMPNKLLVLTGNLLQAQYYSTRSFLNKSKTKSSKRCQRNSKSILTKRAYCCRETQMKSRDFLAQFSCASCGCFVPCSTLSCFLQLE